MIHRAGWGVEPQMTQIAQMRIRGIVALEDVEGRRLDACARLRC